MQFRFSCLVVHHVSGRVTVAPIEHPDLSVHAPSLEDARLDLTLALDDRISRLHPRHVARYATGAEGEAVVLRVPALRVFHGEEHTKLALVLSAWVRAAPSGYREVNVPRLRSRFWVEAGAEVPAALGPVLLEQLEGQDDGARLGLAILGRTTFEVLAIESEPLRLSSLRPEELLLESRPFRTREEQAALDAQNDPARRRQQARAEERRRRERAKRHTPTLKRLAVALHTRSGRAVLSPSWEREAEVARLLAHVERERPLPLLLVAPQGAGKSALQEALALRMGEAGGPRARRARPVYVLDGSRLIAGSGAFGEWQAQLQACLEEARRSGALLMLGRLVDLLDAGRHAHSDHNVAQVLGPALAAREVAVVAEATPEEWALVQRRNASFASVWTTWTLPELSPEATRRVLERVAAHVGALLRVEVQPEVIDATLSLCRRFWPYGALVGNAVTFLRRLVASRAHARAPRVSGLDAVTFFSAEAGIPPVLLRDDLELDPEAVRAFLGARVMAQPQAVERAVQVVSTIKASLQDPRRPAAVLLFAGPTGVGKTELAKSLAEFVFGSRERLVRIDMGEYLGPDALGRLLGEGVEGSDGLLPAMVRRQPFCVLLLDELEKAHPAVFDALLGALGEGRLTDAGGKITDFRNAIIILTTNLGAETLRSRVGFGSVDGAADPAAVRQHYVAEAQRFFRPEFFNRLDDLLVFQPLGPGAIRSIVRREVERMGQREGILRRDLELDVDEAAQAEFAREGFDPRLGARPLKRTLERRLAVPAASWLAAHRQTGPTRLRVEGEPGATAVRFRAESLGRGAEGTRDRAEQVLDEAADVRALVSRWDRAASVRSLRARLHLLERTSGTQTFWGDTQLAEDLSREIAQLRALVEPLATMRQGAEAAEDLALEAWYDRKSDTVETIADELAQLRQRFAPLPRKIYLARDPLVTAGVLYLAAPRSSWSELLGLLDNYRRWAQAHELEVQVSTAEYVDPAARPGTRPSDPDHAYRWEAHAPVGDGPLPAAIALRVRGTEASLLSLETGGHRFADGGDSVVRARFFPAASRTSEGALRPVKSLTEALKVEEIRRYSRSKQRGRDQRLGEDFACTFNGGEMLFDLEAFHVRWIERSCLDEEDIAWT